MSPGMTYAEAGVDIDLENLTIKAIVSGIRRTLNYRKGRIGESIKKEGHYAGLIKLSSQKALAISADGVGSKILVAEMVGKYDTIGIDLIAMNVNDIICLGAEPVALVDYLAMEKPNPKIAREIAKGLSEGARIAGISICGGELATLPEIVKGFDLAGFTIGVVDIDKIITGENITPGDVVVGLESSGIHSNGLTLARKVLLDKYDVNDKLNEKTVGEELLTPTKIYVREVLEALKKVNVKGLAHITGGGLGNLTRITKYGFFLDSLPQPPEIFKRIQEAGEIAEKEMYRTFNMGVGFCIVVGKGDVDETIGICEKFGTKAQKVGFVDRGKGVRIKGKSFTLQY
jgi:phosphoribosylformylglycinamidine cyclo-ligase